VLLIAGASLAEASDAADRIRRSVEQSTGALDLTLSVGVTRFQSDPRATTIAVDRGV
jgi:GGDEF domain-containing protein